jgi:hypothetical protein
MIRQSELEVKQLLQLLVVIAIWLTMMRSGE